MSDVEISCRIPRLERLATKRVRLGTKPGTFGFDPHPIIQVFERCSLETVCACSVSFPAFRSGLPTRQRATEARVTTRRI